MVRSALVAGGAGFLGSHLCDRLIGEGYTVICVDNLSTGNVANIQQFSNDTRFHFIEADIVQPLSLEVDQIYNLACPASPPKYQSDPIRTLKTNVIGTLNLLELAHRSDAHFFHASTSEVYGDAEVHPQTESYNGNVNPIGIRACYDEGKRCAETLLFDFNRMHRVPIKVVRIFNTYGPRMAADDGRVVTNFVNQALKGVDLTIYGDGRQTRSFCYVDDLIDAFMLFSRAEADVTGPLNVGNPDEFTMNELASLVLELTGSSSHLLHQPLPADDPRQRRPDISLATHLLGWVPKVTLRQGLQQTISAFQKM